MSVRTWESGVQAGNEGVGGGLLGRGGPPDIQCGWTESEELLRAGSPAISLPVPTFARLPSEGAFFKRQCSFGFFSGSFGISFLS